MKFKSVEEITSAIAPLADSMGIEIVEVEAKIRKEPHITIYIDTENGVDLDTCEKFHNAVDAVLDELDPSFGASYTLNVSSPGLDRPLVKPRDFERRMGRDVEVKLYAPIKGKKYFEAKLVGYDGKSVELEDESGTKTKLSLTAIAKINEAIKFD
ncbi:MAG: ribosome maturation factor RimP [Clostridia bacterium]|nr:ribosome maturation factor RimP [Clostridia bacterium]